ncbi:vesicular amine transporter [Phlyctema vagabunda]|uniref:Vesicular amine transporter n=1 Tax=Phlyctema vagabunda TaxID=108571 RepID=A0ABR4P2Z5_9HELO
MSDVEYTPDGVPAERSIQESEAPWFLRFRSSKLAIVTTVCAATFSDGFIYAAVVPVLPFALKDRYRVPESEVQFWTSLLLSIFGGFVLLSALVYTVGLTLISNTVPSQDIGLYMGFAISFMSFGILAGPCIGGFVFDLGGYYAVIGTMGIVALVDTMLRLLMIEKSEAKRLSPLGEEDTERTILLPPHTGIVSPNSASSDDEVSSLATTAKFQTFTLLTDPQIVAAMYGVFVQTALCAAFDSVLALFLEETFGWRGSNVALCYFAMSAPMTIMGPVFGRLSDMYGPRWIAVSGFMLNAIPMALLQLITRNERSQVWQLAILLTLSGTTLSMIIPPLAADISQILEDKEKKDDRTAAYAQSYGLLNCAMAATTLVGPGLGGWIKSKYGWTTLCWSCGIFSVTGAVPSVSLTMFPFCCPR